MKQLYVLHILRYHNKFCMIILADMDWSNEFHETIMRADTDFHICITKLLNHSGIFNTTDLSPCGRYDLHYDSQV